MTAQPQAAQLSDDLREHAKRLVADWPPLTPEQRARLGVLLQPANPADTTPARRAA